MHETHSLRERFLVFFKIFVPILIYQFANFSAAFVDTTMTGQYDALHLAGVAMATSLWSPFFTFLTGIVSALVPIIGHHLGAGRKDRVAPDFYQFLYMALGLSLILFALVFLGAPLVLNHLGLEPLVRKVALGYLRFLSLGIIPLLLFSVVRSFLDALGLTRLSMYLMLLLLPLNGFSSMALLVYQSWVELGLVLELQWLIGPFSSFPFRLSESIKRLSPTTLKRSNPLIKQLYLTHLNWVFLLVERSLRRSLSSQVLVWLCLNIRP